MVQNEWLVDAMDGFLVQNSLHVCFECQSLRPSAMRVHTSAAAATAAGPVGATPAAAPAVAAAAAAAAEAAAAATSAGWADGSGSWCCATFRLCAGCEEQRRRAKQIERNQRSETEIK